MLLAQKSLRLCLLLLRRRATAEFSPAFHGDSMLDLSTGVRQLKVRDAADSIKPGVERSETPGSKFENKQTPRSGRQRTHHD